MTISSNGTTQETENLQIEVTTAYPFSSGMNGVSNADSTVTQEFYTTIEDISNATIHSLPTSSKLPTNFSAPYPDNARVNLDGYYAGPAMTYSANWPNGTVDFNTFS